MLDNRELLQSTGLIVFGNFWQKPMCAYLNISTRQMIRWNKGQWLVPDIMPNGQHLVSMLLQLVENKLEKIAVTRVKVEAFSRSCISD